MSAAAVAVPSAPPRRRFAIDLGRPFVHPVFDLLIIGGGLSLVVVVLLNAAVPVMPPAGAIWTIVLLANSAHFAASTVRLYTKEGSFRDLPFVTMGLPLVMLLVLGATLLQPALLGRHWLALYFTWSPYHYAAQAYGLAVMYAYRSGATPSLGDKRLLYAACLLPFIYSFVAGRSSGIEWFLPASTVAAPEWGRLRDAALVVIGVLTFAVPIVVFARGLFTTRARLPVISLVTMIANGVWWVTLSYWNAFIWATIFHSLQYLAIALVFHVKDRQREAGAGGVPTPWWRPALAFYGLSLSLGYVLFQVWPHAGPLMGFAYAQTLALVIATINIHHFIVDAYIWRLRKDANAKVVAAPAGGAAPLPA